MGVQMLGDVCRVKSGRGVKTAKIIRQVRS